MKLAGPRTKDISPEGPEKNVHHNGGREVDYLEIFLVLVMGATALLAFSLLLPEQTAHVAQELIGWCLAGAMAVLALFVAARVLEGLMDG